MSPTTVVPQDPNFHGVLTPWIALVEFKQTLRSHILNYPLHEYHDAPEKLFIKLNPLLNLEEACSALLDFCKSCELKRYIEVFQTTFQYTLNPKQAVAFCILNDFNPPYTEEKSQFMLNNESLLTLMEEKQLSHTEENLEYLRHLAIKWCHPGIYTPCPFAVKSTDVKVNVLWIQENPFTGTESIFDNGAGNKNLNHYLTRITEISSKRPDTSFQIWFDSAQVTRAAFNKTVETILKFKKESQIDLKLCDLRKLEIPSNIMECFHPATPVYFRVDLLKALIPYCAMKDESHPRFCEVRDIDIKQNTLGAVYNAKTLTSLEKIGYVFGQYRGNELSFENSFMIFDVKNPRYQALYKTILIDNLDRLINMQKTIPSRDRVPAFKRIDGERVFGSTMEFIVRDLSFPQEFPTVIVEAPLSSHSDSYQRGKDDRRNETCRFTKEGPIVVSNGHRKGKKEFDFSGWAPRALMVSEEL